MKKTTFTLLLSFSCCWLVAQCPTGDVTFSTQGQIDSFQINYPGCTDIPGNVLISGVDITNLQGLIGLESVSGCLLIKENPVLTSLHGLEYLSLVGGCYIGSPNLERSYGLEISNNAMLVSISELENLKSVEGCITVKGNPLLTALNHLDSLVSVGYCGQFGSGWVFPYRYSIGILGNKNLKTIGGVGILDSIFSLYIIANDSLVSLSGLEGLQTISGRLVVEDNASLPNFNGLNNLQSVGELKVESNQSLKNFEGLENLKNIYCLQISPPAIGWYSFQVNYNGSLIDFSGLENLQRVGCDVGGIVAIQGNWSLQSLSGFGGLIDTTMPLFIYDNDTLATCGVLPICAYLQQYDFIIPDFIYDNAPGCNSVAEVEAACMVSIEETSDGEPVVIFSPNPAGDFLQIQINDPEKWDISLFDLQGRQMFRQVVSGSQIIGVKDWPSGIYALRAVSGGRVFSGKIVKQ